MIFIRGPKSLVQTPQRLSPSPCNHFHPRPPPPPLPNHYEHFSRRLGSFPVWESHRSRSNGLGHASGRSSIKLHQFPAPTHSCLIAQAQLAQTLFSQELPSNMHIQNGRQDAGDVQLCNTPTTRTRSSSFSFGQMGDMTMAQRRSSNAASRSRSRKNSVATNEGWEDVDEMDEDEQMVEDLVTPSSPMPTSANVPNFTFSHRQRPPSLSSLSPITQNSYSEAPSASLFTATDPFYIAQLQAAQTPQTSIFAQSGRPAQQSPFLHHSRHQPQHAYAQPMQTSIAYER